MNVGHINHNIRQFRHFNHRELGYENKQREQKLHAAVALVGAFIARIHHVRRKVDEHLPAIHNFTEIHHPLHPRLHAFHIFGEVTRGMAQQGIQITNDHLRVISLNIAQEENHFRDLAIAFQNGHVDFHGRNGGLNNPFHFIENFLLESGRGAVPRFLRNIEIVCKARPFFLRIFNPVLIIFQNDFYFFVGKSRVTNLHFFGFDVDNGQRMSVIQPLLQTEHGSLQLFDFYVTIKLQRFSFAIVRGAFAETAEFGGQTVRIGHNECDVRQIQHFKELFFLRFPPFGDYGGKARHLNIGVYVNLRGISLPNGAVETVGRLGAYGLTNCHCRRIPSGRVGPDF